ncbi:MAG: transporter substrate-binding protein [Actinotalea sp.]|nr:transporter substrate-binding protein [Actinotalea sp.]
MTVPIPPPLRRATWRRAAGALPVLLLSASLAACSSAGAASGDGGPASGTLDELRLGYFANVTHAPAVIGVAEGLIQDELGETELRTEIFNAGPSAIEALNAGAVDATFIGPNPAINGFVKSDGDALRIISGVTSGGAQLVVRPGIESPEDLAGAHLATPQLGGTQDVALRAWLGEQGFETSLTGEGDVTITPTENAQTLQLFRDGTIDGAWLPEPWASRLVLEAGAEVLVDEADLWEGGQFLTTHLIVSRTFLEEHPDAVEALLRGTVASVDWLEANPDEGATAVNAEIEELTGKPLQPEVIARAFEGVTFSVDPLAGTLATLLEDGVTAGTTEEASLDGIYDLRPLNAVLTELGRPTVSAAGLGEE